MTRVVEGIIIHCLDVNPDWDNGKTDDEVLAEIRRWHVEENGWSDIGYNTIIRRDGTVLGGRDLDNDGDNWEEIGAHARGNNKTSIGICLIGGRGSTANDAFSDHYTIEQDKALRRTIIEVEKYFKTIKWIRGHNEFAAKACPGFNVPRWVAGKAPKQATAITAVTGGSKTATGATGVGALAVVSQYSGQAKQVINDVEQALGIDPVIIVLIGFAAWFAYDRIKKFKRGVT